MNSAVALYEALTSAPDDRTRARLIAEAFERLEERYPHLPDLATQGHVREAELRLQKETEQIRGDIKTVELTLQKEIEEIRGDIKTVELTLRKEIEEVRGDIKAVELTLQKEIEQVRVEIARTKNDLLKWLVPLMFGQVLAIAALVKLL
jgi:vacuolar-type H+-ATPase subunit I/STV1